MNDAQLVWCIDYARKMSIIGGYFKNQKPEFTRVLTSAEQLEKEQRDKIMAEFETSVNP